MPPTAARSSVGVLTDSRGVRRGLVTRAPSGEEESRGGRGALLLAGQIHKKGEEPFLCAVREDKKLNLVTVLSSIVVYNYFLVC